MDTPQPTISIGIPALNEERNIGRLIDVLLAQRISSARLMEVLVISDASTDRTVEIVQSYADSRVKVIQKAERQGAYKSQNEIVEKATGDILVLLNADILPADEQFIEELIKPIIADSQVGIVCGQAFTTSPRTHIEKVLTTSFEFKKDMYSHLNGGNNLYFCVGIARALSRTMYQQLRWPQGMPEDAYSYFACLKAGLKFKYTPSAKIVFRTPSTLQDHLKQSTRYYGGRAKMEHLFGTEVVDRGYHIPLFVGMAAGFRYFLRTPLLALSYPILVMIVRLLLSKSYQPHWKIATSTKEAIPSQRNP